MYFISEFREQEICHVLIFNNESWLWPQCWEMYTYILPYHRVNIYFLWPYTHLTWHYKHFFLWNNYFFNNKCFHIICQTFIYRAIKNNEWYTNDTQCSRISHTKCFIPSAPWMRHHTWVSGLQRRPLAVVRQLICNAVHGLDSINFSNYTVSHTPTWHKTACLHTCVYTYYIGNCTIRFPDDTTEHDRCI